MNIVFWCGVFQTWMPSSVIWAWLVLGLALTRFTSLVETYS